MEAYGHYLSERDRLLHQFYLEAFSKEAAHFNNDLSEFYRDLKKAVLDQKIPPVTNLDNKTHHHFGVDIYTRYQRQGHTILHQDLLSLIYKNEESSLEVKGFFSNNCQIANFSLLHALSNLYPNAELYYPTKKIYFESEYILKRFGKIFNGNGSQGKICFIDSAQIRKEEDLFCFETLSDCIMVVLDTTCYDRNSDYIWNCIQRASKIGLPVVLTRSHLKLDSFGTEYSSLGSCLFVGFNDEKVFKETYDFLSHIGGFALIEQIYPFLFDEKLKALTSHRVEQIRKNTKEIYALVDLNQEKVGFFQSEYLHSLSFVYVYNRDKVEFIKTGAKFQALCDLFGIKGKFCDSFGFDFFSLTNVDSFDEFNNGFLRFCSPVDSSQVSNSANIVNQLIRSIQRKA